MQIYGRPGVFQPSVKRNTCHPGQEQPSSRLRFSGEPFNPEEFGIKGLAQVLEDPEVANRLQQALENAGIPSGRILYTGLKDGDGRPLCIFPYKEHKERLKVASLLQPATPNCPNLAHISGHFTFEGKVRLVFSDIKKLEEATGDSFQALLL